jgi:peptide/nickel transport system permease protein
VTAFGDVPTRRLRSPDVRLGLHTPRRVSWAVLGLVGVLTLVAVLAPLITPHDPVQPVGGLNLPPGSDGYPLGTDGIGRDLLSRTLVGVQVSWFSALLIVASGLIVGGLVGVVAGAVGGWADMILMRITDLFLALPGALVAIAVVAALGYGLPTTLLGVGLVWWPYYARIVRGEVRSVMVLPHVEAARVAGIGWPRVLLRHVIPGVVPTAIVAASLDVGNVILLLAGLSFLGLGQPAPAAELGADTARGLGQMLTEWWIPVVPGVAVLLLSLLANLGGDAVRTLLGRTR